jgi:hypothetical protein
MKRLRRLFEKFKKPIAIIAATTMFLTTTAAVAPPKAEAGGLFPWGCQLMLDYPSSKVLIYWCAIAVAIDCCDPTGDGWLND